MEWTRLASFGMLVGMVAGCSKGPRFQVDDADLQAVIRRDVAAATLLEETPPPRPAMAPVGQASEFEARIVVVHLADRTDSISKDLGLAMRDHPEQWTFEDMVLFEKAGYLSIQAAPVIRTLPSDPATIAIQRLVPEKGIEQGLRIDVAFDEAPEGAVAYQNISIHNDLWDTTLDRTIPELRVPRGRNALITVDNGAPQPRHFVLIECIPIAGG